MRVANSIPVWFTVTTCFAVPIRQSPVLAGPPVAYYRLGEAPGSIIAVDLSGNARNGVYKGTPTWRVLDWNAAFTIEAWVQLIDDYQIDSGTFGTAGTGAGNAYGLDLSLSGAGLAGSADFSVLTMLNDGLIEAPGVLGEVAIPDYSLAPAPVESPHPVGTLFETSALTSVLGLALILFGLVPEGWRTPLRFRGAAAGLSRASIFEVGAVSLRRRSESELNSFSARYATIEAQPEAPLAGCGVPVAFPRPPSASHQVARSYK